MLDGDVDDWIVLIPGFNESKEIFDVNDTIAVEVDDGLGTKDGKASTVGPDPRASLPVEGKTGGRDMWQPGVPLVEHPPVLSIESGYPAGRGMRTAHPHP